MEVELYRAVTSLIAVDEDEGLWGGYHGKGGACACVEAEEPRGTRREPMKGKGGQEEHLSSESAEREGWAVLQAMPAAAKSERGSGLQRVEGRW